MYVFIVWVHLLRPCPKTHIRDGVVFLQKKTSSCPVMLSMMNMVKICVIVYVGYIIL